MEGAGFEPASPALYLAALPLSYPSEMPPVVWKGLIVSPVCHPAASIIRCLGFPPLLAVASSRIGLCRVRVCTHPMLSIANVMAFSYLWGCSNPNTMQRHTINLDYARN